MESTVFQRALRKLSEVPILRDRRGIVSVETAIIGSVISILALASSISRWLTAANPK